MTTRIRFTPPAKVLNLNDRMHWRPKAALTATWREAAFIAACRMGSPGERAHPPCEVRFYLPVRDRRERDGHNYSPTAKACIDGFVQAGIWPKDSTEWVELRDTRFTRMTTDVVVELRPVGEVDESPWPNGDEKELGMARVRELREQLSRADHPTRGA